MFRFTVFALALFCAGLVFASDHTDGTFQIGSFEGTYTSPFGLGTNVCQDGDFVYGYADESFIFRGTATGDSFSGNFYQAGYQNCATGTIELSHTSWGMEGSYVCYGNDRTVAFSAVKQSVFRPTADECAELYSGSDLDLEGRYLDVHSHALDLCFRTPDDDNDDDDDETVQASLERDDPDGNVIEQFVTGFHYADGKIFVGTWYEYFDAGAVMMFLREDGSVDYSYWTGLLGRNGGTFIDQTHLFDSSLHYTGTWVGPRESTLASTCVIYEALQQVVLQNLRAAGDEDDDNYYYFVDTFYMSASDIRYHVQQDSSDARTLVLSFIACFVLAILF